MEQSDHLQGAALDGVYWSICARVGVGWTRSSNIQPTLPPGSLTWYHWPALPSCSTSSPRRRVPWSRPALEGADRALAAPTMIISFGRSAPVPAHLPEAAYRQLRRLGIDQGKTVQRMAEEAFNDYFAKHGLPEIAGAAGS